MFKERKSKKVMVSMLVFVLLSLFYVSPVYANVTDINKQITIANKQIEKAIDLAQKAGQIATTEYNKKIQQDGNNPAKIAQDTAEYNRKINEIISVLTQLTNRISDQLYQEALKENITLTRYTVNVTIGNRTVQVDPFVNS